VLRRSIGYDTLSPMRSKHLSNNGWYFMMGLEA
jgi:hypothetical protein